MPKYLVKLNEKSFIGGDLMICKADDLTSPYPPECLESLRDAEELAGLYGGRVVELVLIDVKARNELLGGLNERKRV